MSLEKRIGEPCPTCSTPLQRRKSIFRTIVGDVAFCSFCRSSFEIAREEDPEENPPPELPIAF